MKSKLLLGISSFFFLSACHAAENELGVFKIKNSYLVFSSNQNGKVYSWLKLAGDDAQSDATSGSCDILFSGIQNKKLLKGSTLNFETDISQSSKINDVVAYKDKQTIFFNGDKIFKACGMNVVYGEFLKINNNSKNYDQSIKEVLQDNLYDIKNNKNPNTDAYSNLVNNLNCTYVQKNLVTVNDLGYFLEQKNYLNDANQVLKKVVDCAPARAVAYLNLGDVFIKQSKNEEAKFYYNISLYTTKKDNSLK